MRYLLLFLLFFHFTFAQNSKIALFAFELGLQAFEDKNWSLAKESFLKAELSGLSEASYNLALTYEELSDFEEAKNSYKKSIDAGMKQAHFNLAVLYIRERNYLEAIRNLKESVHYLEDFEAAFLLAQIYERNPNHRNLHESKSWYEKACQLKSKDACHRLGLAYDLSQLDLPADEEKAFDFYQMASDLGHVHSKYNLALALGKRGKVLEAKELLRECSKAGLHEAFEALKTLEKLQK